MDALRLFVRDHISELIYLLLPIELYLISIKYYNLTQKIVPATGGPALGGDSGPQFGVRRGIGRCYELRGGLPRQP